MSAEGRDTLRLGQLVELSIEKDVYRGRGLGRVGGQIVFVPRAHAGDRVLVRVSEVRRDWARGALVEVLEPAPARRTAPCPHAPVCGGCAYQQIGYEEQLRVKEAVLRESLARALVPVPDAFPIRGSPEQGWRLRASLHFAVADGQLQLGLRQEGSRRLVDVERCLQISRAMNAAARSLYDALSSSAVLRSLRHLELIEEPNGEALLAVLDTTLGPGEAQALAALGQRVSGVTGFGVRCEKRLVWLRGAPAITVEVLGLRLRTHVDSFFQGNRFLLEPLARQVRDLVPGEGGRILDLYSGVGLFALPLAARDGCEVIAVEGGGQAAEDAQANARRAGLARVRVIADDVGRTLAGLERQSGERIVLDPPRTGAGPGVVDRIAQRAPSSVVYVSCDPPTLARDLARFASHGYRVEQMALFDLFPDTFHMETVVRLAGGRPSRM